MSLHMYVFPCACIQVGACMYGGTCMKMSASVCRGALCINGGRIQCLLKVYPPNFGYLGLSPEFSIEKL